MTESTVSKWGQMEPLADGTCHCGQPMKYNLAAGIVGHTDPAVNATCTEPWPDEPNPAGWALSRGIGAVIRRLGQVMDRVALADQRDVAKYQALARHADAAEAAGEDVRFEFAEPDRTALPGVETATIVRTGDRLIVTLPEHATAAHADSAVRLLNERLPGVDFTILCGARVVVLPAPEEPQHERGRERTDEEHAALEATR